jgi:glycosyltransferase involved in cell wall biosynthesis
VYRGKRIAVVVPAHNEAARIGRVLSTMPHFVDRVIVVDDGSMDGTAARARESASAVPLEILRRRANGGVGAAIGMGYACALARGEDIVAVMGGDAQMDPAELPALLDPLVEGRADFSKGNRLAHPDVWREMPPIRLLGNALLTLATRWAVGIRVTDSQCGYTAITREALASLPLSDLYPRYGFPNDLLMKIAASGLRVAEMTVRPIYHAGPSASGIVLRRFIPRVAWLLAAAFARRVLRRGEWARPPARPRVLILTSSYPRGPEDHAGHFVASFARRLAARYDVTVLAPWDGSAPRRSIEKDGALAVHRFRYAPLARLHRVAYGAGIEANLSSWSSRVWLPAFFMALTARSILAAWRSDVVVSNWLLPSGAAGALCRALTRRPHLAIEHGGGLAALRGERRRRLLRAILAGTDRVICVSAALRDDLVTGAAGAGVRLRTHDVPVIPMGIETSAFDGPTGPRAREVLFLGRFIPVKGVEVLIDAMARIPDASLTLAGDGPLASALKARAALLGARVRFPGVIHGVLKDRALSRAAILAVPSVVLPGGRTEGFPVVVLEGMAAGCAVVASDVGGIGEVVRDGWNGVLVKPGEVEALAERIRWLLDRPELCAQLGQRGAEHARAYDAELVAARLLAEVDRVASRTPA